jgi:2-phosphoglycolate phosphatase
MINTPTALLFDLDGTLVDTAPDLAGAIIDMQAARCLPTSPFQLLRPFASAGAQGLLNAGFGITPDASNYDELRHEFLERYENRIARESSIFEGITPLLNDLQNNNIVWGIVTNKSERLAQKLINALELDTHCAVLVGGDSTNHSKPNPKPCLFACEKLNIDPASSWFIGDDIRDIQAGKAANMYTIAAAYGYCNYEVHSIQTWQANRIVYSPKELHQTVIAVLK